MHARLLKDKVKDCTAHWERCHEKNLLHNLGIYLGLLVEKKQVCMSARGRVFVDAAVPPNSFFFLEIHNLKDEPFQILEIQIIFTHNFEYVIRPYIAKVRMKIIENKSTCLLKHCLY